MNYLGRKFIPGNNSVIAIRPVVLEIWKREGWRLESENMYVMKLDEAICSANCLRILHSSSGPTIDRIMYLDQMSCAQKREKIDTRLIKHHLAPFWS